MRKIDRFSSIQQYSDETADTYDVAAFSVADYKLLDVASGIFQKYEFQGGSVLDLGCGTGLLKEHSAFDRYTGVDVSEKMLEHARSRGYTCIQGFIEDELALIPDRSFDFVVALSSLYYVSDSKIDAVMHHIEPICTKGWLLSLEDLPEQYIEKAKIYFSTLNLSNHSKLNIVNLTEDLYIPAWSSPLVGNQISARVVMKLKEKIS
jgi:predicted TPR repeat methyltransferase